MSRGRHRSQTSSGKGTAQSVDFVGKSNASIDKGSHTEANMKERQVSRWARRRVASHLFGGVVNPVRARSAATVMYRALKNCAALIPQASLSNVFPGIDKVEVRVRYDPDAGRFASGQPTRREHGAICRVQFEGVEATVVISTCNIVGAIPFLPVFTFARRHFPVLGQLSPMNKRAASAAACS